MVGHNSSGEPSDGTINVEPSHNLSQSKTSKQLVSSNPYRLKHIKPSSRNLLMTQLKPDVASSFDVLNYSSHNRPSQGSGQRIPIRVSSNNYSNLVLNQN